MEKVSYNPFMHSLPVTITMPEINDTGNLFSYQLNEIQNIHTFEKKKKGTSSNYISWWPIHRYVFLIEI